MLLKMSAVVMQYTCSTLFSEENHADLGAQVSFLTREQFDVVILRSIMATVNTDKFQPSYTRHKPAKRQNGYNIHEPSL